MSAVPEALAARFRADLEALAGPLGQRRLGLAVSGGADSMAMLALARAAFPGQVEAATVDHRLRPESAGEAAMVARWCAGAGVPHATLAVPAPPQRGDNLHDWARRQRYRLLEHWAIDAGLQLLATAHHADDQAETFLMRAARGSGVAGLAGIRAHRPAAGAGALDLVRPLLGWRRAELRALAELANVPFVDDPSNTDDRFDRTQVRALIATTPLLDAAQLARAAGHVGDADAALRAMESWLWAKCRVVPAGADDPEVQTWLDVSGLPRELKRRLARAAIADVRLVNGITRPAFGDSANVEALLDALEAGTSATQAGILASPAGDLWRFREAPPRRSR